MVNASVRCARATTTLSETAVPDCWQCASDAGHVVRRSTTETASWIRQNSTTRATYSLLCADCHQNTHHLRQASVKRLAVDIRELL